MKPGEEVLEKKISTKSNYSANKVFKGNFKIYKESFDLLVNILKRCA